MREKLARQLQGIRHWKVLPDYRLGGMTQEATYFVDPPYFGRLGKRYPAHDLDYDELARWCRSLSGQVIVCENEGATWLPFKPFRVIKGTEGANRTGDPAQDAAKPDCTTQLEQDLMQAWIDGGLPE